MANRNGKRLLFHRAKRSKPIRTQRVTWKECKNSTFAIVGCSFFFVLVFFVLLFVSSKQYYVVQINQLLATVKVEPNRTGRVGCRRSSVDKYRCFWIFVQAEDSSAGRGLPSARLVLTHGQTNCGFCGEIVCISRKFAFILIVRTTSTMTTKTLPWIVINQIEFLLYIVLCHCIIHLNVDNECNVVM